MPQGWWIEECKSAANQSPLSQLLPEHYIHIKNSSFKKLSVPHNKKKNAVKILITFLHYSKTHLHLMFFTEFNIVLDQLTL